MNMDTTMTAQAWQVIAEAALDEITDRLRQDTTILDPHEQATMCWRCEGERTSGAAPGGLCVTCAMELATEGHMIRPRRAGDCCEACHDDISIAHTPLRWTVEEGDRATCWYRCPQGHEWTCGWSAGLLRGDWDLR